MAEIELRRSARLATKGCQKELILTMKKPGKLNKDSSSTEKHSASTEKDSASTEKHFDRDSLVKGFKNFRNRSEEIQLQIILGYAQNGLKLYQKRNKDTVFDFKSIEVLYFQQLRLIQVDTKRTEFWMHVCITAKPENSNASPKYFLVEVKRDPTCCWNARRCCMFEPKDVAGIDHGCIICTNNQKIHPIADQYYVGHTLTWRNGTMPCR